MTVEELAKLLQTKHPKARVFLSFKRYTPVRTRSRALKPVAHPIKQVVTFPDEHKVFLVADQKGDYY